MANEDKQHELFQKLSDAVVEMEEDETRDLAGEVVTEGVDPLAAIENGLVDGMNRAGDLFEAEEYFIPELLLCSDAMYAGLDVLKPHLKQDRTARRPKIVIGVVEGDTHDIGKNLVKIMLESAGFEIIDLGRDVPPANFVKEAREKEASVIAMSTLMTTTMGGMGEVIRLLKEQGIRDDVKVIVGGGPISQSFADKIGADGYSSNAPDAVRLVKRLLKMEA